ncbi:putative dehydrogenase [Flavobacterium arsenatis]|uniref:Dehydrogenase n=1 Tax=Flavobacterium arsenatis TaxID=1484332 RepID=A0ABU1TTS5_9FLAO|nr:Gfo/Idh/MocA family oxidoreductase [Flavobacterium arsenatis]MDR6969277.1 putative dehydrogenase [Flavobacterium arsenatis]
MKKIRWGILGTGGIAHRFASDMGRVEGAEITAVGSRSLESAENFCSGFDIPFSFGTYKELAESDVVDVVYIATPHSLHHHNTMLCLNGGKSVLCEKPFALNSMQAAEMIGLSHRKELFLMDALWTKCLPHYRRMMEIVESGDLGEIRAVLANFGFRVNPGHSSRLLDPALGGGSLMDIGIYNVFIALDVLGKPDDISARISATADGIDEQCAVTFQYSNGAMASLYSSLSAELSTEVEICGTAGRIKLTTPFHGPASTIEYYADGIKTIIDIDNEGGYGYQHEIRHVNECLRAGLIQSKIVTHVDSLLLMDTLDAIRRLVGIAYPCD